MLKQIHAEWYKAARRPYFRNLILCSVLCGVGVSAILFWLKDTAAAAAPEQINLPFALLSMLFFMVTGLYFVVLGADLVFSDQYKYNTLKNEVSFGLPRWGVYLSRWVISLVMMLLMLAALLGSYALVSAALLGIPSDAVAMEQMGMTSAQMMGYVFQVLGSYLLASLPLWMGGLSLILCLMFLIQSSTFASIAYVAVVAALPGVLDKMGQYVNPLFTQLYHLTLSYPFDLINHAGASIQSGGQMALCWSIGLGWTLLATFVGGAVFQRLEIK